MNFTIFFRGKYTFIQVIKESVAKRNDSFAFFILLTISTVAREKGIKGTCSLSLVNSRKMFEDVQEPELQRASENVGV